MAVGFQSISNSGTYQITDAYINIQLKTKSTITMSATTYDGGTQDYGEVLFYYYDVVITNAISPMIAINCTDFVSVIKLDISGSTWTYRLAAATAVTLTYYVLDKGVTSTNFGLAIYDSTGALSFSSADKNLDIKAYITGLTQYTDQPGTVSETRWYEGSITLTAGRTYAFIPGPSGAQINTVTISTPGKNPGDPPTYSASSSKWYGGAKVNNEVISYKSNGVLYYYISGITSDLGFEMLYQVGNILVVDVTGL
jgi:hypothetical protein